MESIRRAVDALCVYVRNYGMATSTITPDMSGHKLAAVETIHGGVGPTDINVLLNQLVRGAVVVANQLDMAVDVDGV